METPQPICPLCQQPNLCGKNAGTDCWCVREKFPAELLARVPDNAPAKACVCIDCLRDYERRVNPPPANA